MGMNPSTRPGRRPLARIPFFVHCLALLPAILTSIPRSTYAEKNIDEVRERADQGDTETQFNLGACYFSEAVKWFRKAAE